MHGSIFPQAKSLQAGDARARVRRKRGIEGPLITKGLSHAIRAFEATPVGHAFAFSRLVVLCVPAQGVSLYDGEWKTATADGPASGVDVGLRLSTKQPALILAGHCSHNDTVTIHWLRIGIASPTSSAQYMNFSETTKGEKYRLTYNRAFILPPAWQVWASTDGMGAGFKVSIFVAYRLLQPGDSIPF